MALKSEAAGTRTARSVDLSWDNPDFDHELKPSRDWKKLFLVLGLGGLSWVATYVGMLELIEANMGDLPLIHKCIIGFSVAMLMVMVVWLLDQMFSEIGWFSRTLYAAGYVFLTVISVGFGFGFYWKVLESRSEASRSAESAVGQVQNSLHAAMTRLEQLQGTLDSLTAISTQKAETERASGTSCPNSKPGDGPRRKMRDDDASRFKFASDFVKGRIGAVKAEMTGLDGDLARIVKDDKSTVDARSGTRNEFMRNLGRKLDMTVTGFNAFRSDPQLKQIRADLNDRADKVTFIDTKGGSYTCPDGQLTTALKGVVRAIDELPSLEKPRIAAVEGSEAVIEAFRRLTSTFYGALAFKLPPSPEDLRELQKKAVQSVENAGAQQAKINALAEQAGLSKRDYVPLAIAIFVDLCLLLVSMRHGGGNRLQNLLPKMRAAERGPVIQILSRFNEIHRDSQIRENFEVFRHVVFDFHGDYYAAVPLNAPYRPNPRNGQQRQGYGVSDAHDLLQEAHLLSNLFASFEQEKIFTRVYSPLLSTRTVQKRLRRQGSKFANAEAFRIYRFRNGAWSDIILGAVMGAARRVEAEQRRRRIEKEVFESDGGRTEPRLETTHNREMGAATPAAVSIDNSPPYPFVVGGKAWTGAANPGHAGPDQLGSSSASMPSSAMGAGSASHQHSIASAASPAGKYTMSRQPAPWPHASEAAADDKHTVATPANNNTAPAHRSGAQTQEPAAQSEMLTDAAQHAGALYRPLVENVVMHPATSRPHGPAMASAAAPAAPQPRTEGALARAIKLPQQQEPNVTVAAIRETITYTLPVSEAALPQALVRAAAGKPSLSDTAVDDAELATAELTSVEDGRVLPLPLPDAVPATDVAAVSAPAVTEPVISTADVVSLTEIGAEHGARIEREAWDIAKVAGWEQEQAAALDAQTMSEDEYRTMALRLRPDKRDA